MKESLICLKADITKLAVDVIVNAANSSLLGGGGVDGAIHRAGGPAILEECRQIVARQGGCKTGQAVITGAGNLPAKYVVHTVGPVWNQGGEEKKVLLAACYRHSLELAVEKDCKTVAFPNISTGVYGFPKEEAAEIATQTISEFLKQNHSIENSIEQVILVCFDDENFSLTKTSLEKLKDKEL